MAPAVKRANPDHPVILSGRPTYQRGAFIVPVDARPMSGYLQIDATSQGLDGVEGVLRSWTLLGGIGPGVLLFLPVIIEAGSALRKTWPLRRDGMRVQWRRVI